jgi:hypothetical protein
VAVLPKGFGGVGDWLSPELKNSLGVYVVELLAVMARNTRLTVRVLMASRSCLEAHEVPRSVDDSKSLRGRMVSSPGNRSSAAGIEAGNLSLWICTGSAVESLYPGLE